MAGWRPGQWWDEVCKVQEPPVLTAATFLLQEDVARLLPALKVRCGLLLGAARAADGFSCIACRSLATSMPASSPCPSQPVPPPPPAAVLPTE